MKKALIVNDTSYENHHGCELVIKNIHKLLEKNNIKVIATNPTGVDWFKNRKFIRSIYKADIVIINGEGTLHHYLPDGDLNLSPLRGIHKIPIVNNRKTLIGALRSIHNGREGPKDCFFGWTKIL